MSLRMSPQSGLQISAPKQGGKRKKSNVTHGWSRASCFLRLSSRGGAKRPLPARAGLTWSSSTCQRFPPKISAADVTPGQIWERLAPPAKSVWASANENHFGLKFPITSNKNLKSVARLLLITAFLLDVSEKINRISKINPTKNIHFSLVFPSFLTFISSPRLLRSRGPSRESRSTFDNPTNVS